MLGCKQFLWVGNISDITCRQIWIGKITSNFDESFIKTCVENSGKGYIFNANAEFLKQLHDSHNDLPFLLKRMKVKRF